MANIISTQSRADEQEGQREENAQERRERILQRTSTVALGEITTLEHKVGDNLRKRNERKRSAAEADVRGRLGRCRDSAS
jgi:hypothetical protein